MKMLNCPRCGKQPTVHKDTFADREMTAIYCEQNPCVGSLSWFFTEEDAVDEWNIGAITRAFLDGKITWEEAKKQARSVSRKEVEA